MGKIKETVEDLCSAGVKYVPPENQSDDQLIIFGLIDFFKTMEVKNEECLTNFAPEADFDFSKQESFDFSQFEYGKS